MTEGAIHHQIIVSDSDARMTRKIERYILAYCGADLLHDVELTFPGASYRAFFLGFRRAQATERKAEALRRGAP
jgi:hypothetical protein